MFAPHLTRDFCLATKALCQILSSSKKVGAASYHSSIMRSDVKSPRPHSRLGWPSIKRVQAVSYPPLAMRSAPICNAQS